jgi:hypothetical protein
MRRALDELVERVAAAVDGWWAGSVDADAVDEVLHRYQRCARELWKFLLGQRRRQARRVDRRPSSTAG